MAGHGHGSAVNQEGVLALRVDQDKGTLGKPPVFMRFGVRPWRLRGAGRGLSRERVLSSATFLEKHNTVVILKVFIIIVYKISISL